MPRFAQHRSSIWVSMIHGWIALRAGKAWACPDCAIGRAARASVLDHDFAGTLLTIAAPLLVLAVVAAVLHRMDLEP